MVLGRTCTPSPLPDCQGGREARGRQTGALGGFADLEDLGAADRARARGRRLAVLHGDCFSALDLALLLAFEAIASGHVLSSGWLGGSATARRQVARILDTSGPNWSRIQAPPPAAVPDPTPTRGRRWSPGGSGRRLGCGPTTAG